MREQKLKRDCFYTDAKHLEWSMPRISPYGEYTDVWNKAMYCTPSYKKQLNRYPSHSDEWYKTSGTKDWICLQLYFSGHRPCCFCQEETVQLTLPVWFLLASVMARRAKEEETDRQSCCRSLGRDSGWRRTWWSLARTSGWAGAVTSSSWLWVRGQGYWHPAWAGGSACARWWTCRGSAVHCGSSTTPILYLHITLRHYMWLLTITFLHLFKYIVAYFLLCVCLFEITYLRWQRSWYLRQYK